MLIQVCLSINICVCPMLLGISAPNDNDIRSLDNIPMRMNETKAKELINYSSHCKCRLRVIVRVVITLLGISMLATFIILLTTAPMLGGKITTKYNSKHVSKFVSKIKISNLVILETKDAQRLFSNGKIVKPDAHDEDRTEEVRNRYLLIAAVCEWIFTLMIIIHMVTFVPDFMLIGFNKATISYIVYNVGKDHQLTENNVIREEIISSNMV